MFDQFAAQSVAIESAPIYLCDPPGHIHAQALQVVAAIAHGFRARGSQVQLHVLMDELTCDDRGYREAYLSLLPMQAHRVMLESDLIDPARALLAHISDKQIDCGGLQGQLRRLKNGSKPLLVTDSGRPACALLDSAFQISKHADLSIIVHPICMLINGTMVDFRDQQHGVMDVISVLRVPGQPLHPHLPWPEGMVHVWLDEQGCIESVAHIRNHKRGLRGSVLRDAPNQIMNA